MGHANSGTTMHAKDLMSHAHQHSFTSHVTADWSTGITVKTFNLAALKVGCFACKIILTLFILANSNHTIPIDSLTD